ncbi:hypothetical protein V1522DRAFT_415070 [Lipomyces starkeyi]
MAVRYGKAKSTVLAVTGSPPPRQPQLRRRTMLYINLCAEPHPIFKLLENFTGPPLTVLFASDRVNAEDVARRLQRRAHARTGAHLSWQWMISRLKI